MTRSGDFGKILNCRANGIQTLVKPITNIGVNKNESPGRMIQPLPVEKGASNSNVAADIVVPSTQVVTHRTTTVAVPKRKVPNASCTTRIRGIPVRRSASWVWNVQSNASDAVAPASSDSPARQLRRAPSLPTVA